MRYIAYRIVFIMFLTIAVNLILRHFGVAWEYVLFAGVMALLLSILIFPAPSEKKFRNCVQPIFFAYENYLRVVIDAFYQKEINLSEKRIAVETALLNAPAWVYTKGYNKRLREGHRHFLVRIAEMGEILFSMHMLTRESCNKKILQHMREDIYFVTEQMILLLQSIQDAISLQKPKAIVEDWYDRIQYLEKIFYEALPNDFELLDADAKKEYLTIAALLQDFKDLRYFLLKCVQAIR